MGVGVGGGVGGWWGWGGGGGRTLGKLRIPHPAVSPAFSFICESADTLTYEVSATLRGGRVRFCGWGVYSWYYVGLNFPDSPIQAAPWFKEGRIAEEGG